MEYKELIDRLREHAETCTRGLSREAIMDYFEQAADAIEVLLAERDAALEKLQGD